MTIPTVRKALALLALLAMIASARGGPQGPTAAAEPGQPGQPGQLGQLGMNTYFTGLERNSRDGEAGVGTLIGRGRELGVAWAREELSWGNLERDAKGVWRWSHFDRRLLAMAQAGYGIVGMLLTTPAWARVGDCRERIARFASSGVVASDYWCPPANPQDYADYVSAVVERYDGDGVDDAPGAPRVAAWQIWNEPNAWETWPGTPAEYAAILQAGYAAAKAADPTATVATGGLYVLDSAWKDEVGHWDGLRFLDEALLARSAIWGSFDALAIHPYMPDVAPDQPGIYGAVTMWGRLTTARLWLEERRARYGGWSRPLWISEVGWSTCSAAESDCYAGAGLSAPVPGAPAATGAAATAAPYTPAWRLTLGPTASRPYAAPMCPEPGPCPPSLGPSADSAALIGKSEQQQASYLVRAHAIALALGVRHISWFQLEDKFDGSARTFWEEAAILRTAPLGYAEKPAAAAYRVMAGLLGAATFVGYGPLHTFAHSPTEASPAARFHLRFRTGDGALLDVIWSNAGAEEVDLPVLPGTSPQVFGRDGAPLAASVGGGTARLSIGEAPLYVRHQTWPVTARLRLPQLWR